MSSIRRIVHEVFGLFVDDGSFALGILIWLGVMAWAAFHLRFSSTTLGILLFVGLVLILIESTIRYARKAVVTKK